MKSIEAGSHLHFGASETDNQRGFEVLYAASMEKGISKRETCGALAKARDTVRAEDLALQAMFGNGQLAIKRSEAIKSWEPIILQLAADINACAMLRRSISCKWFRDPSRAHEERYRDETDWTDRVRDGGVESIDVLYRVKTHSMN